MAPPPPPTARKGMSKGVIGGIVAVVVVIIVILGLGFSGIIPGFKIGGSSSGGSSGPSYAVTFSETGLPAGISWTVTFNGQTLSSTTSTIAFSEHNGTYSFSVSASGYTATPASGSLTVSGVSSKSITFAALPPGSYTVTFTESGLPTGMTWSVTLNSAQESSTGTSISFTETNGTYSFTVGSVTGYTASPSSGMVTVSGPTSPQSITFTSSGGGGGGAQLYSQAKSVADGTVSGHSSSAVLVGAFGFDLLSAYTNSTSNDTNASCPLTGGSTSSLTIPTYTGNYHAGESPAWLFLYYQPSPVAEFAVAVLNGAGTYIGEVAGSTCVGNYGVNDTIPSTIIDSNAAAAAAAATPNGSAFIAHNSSANADYVLLGTNSSAPGAGTVWAIIFSTCSPGFTGIGTTYEAEVNATSGVVEFNFTFSFDCSGGIVPISAGTTLGGGVTSAALSGVNQLIAVTVARS
jgi:hypothetical protein